MNRVHTILDKARDSLADPNKERWSDEKLLRLLSDGQKDIARQTMLLKGEVDIPLAVGQAVYDLPEDLWLITRATYNGEVIDMFSYADMDRKDQGWFARTGARVTALVYDKRNLHKLRLWPTPDATIAGDDYIQKNEGYVGKTMDSATGVYAGYNADQANQLQGILTSFKNIAPTTFNSPYGIVTNLIAGDMTASYHPDYMGAVMSIDGVPATPPYGVVTDLEDELFSSPFGIVTNIRDIKGTVRIQYIKDAPEVLTMSSELTLPALFDTALKFYIVGMAFSDDLDTEYQAKSDRALTHYQREVDLVGGPAQFRDGTKATQYRGQYRSVF